MKPIYIPTSKEKVENDLCELHTKVCNHLGAVQRVFCTKTNSYMPPSPSYTGEQRECMIDLKDLIEAAILDDKTDWFSVDRLQGLYMNVYDKELYTYKQRRVE
jgi:hypothetical protein